MTRLCRARRLALTLSTLACMDRDAAVEGLEQRTRCQSIGTACEGAREFVFYAQALGCHEAALVYPVPLARPTNAWVGDIHVRTLTFSLEGDLNSAGEHFVESVSI